MSISERNGLKNRNLHQFHQFEHLIGNRNGLVTITITIKYSKWLKKIETKIHLDKKELNFTQKKPIIHKIHTYTLILIEEKIYLYWNESFIYIGCIISIFRKKKTTHLVLPTMS